MAKKRLSCEIDPGLLEWMKDYQYTLLTLTGQVITIQDIVETAVNQYKETIPLKAKARPEYIVNRDKVKGKKISSTHKANARAKK